MMTILRTRIGMLKGIIISSEQKSFTLKNKHNRNPLSEIKPIEKEKIGCKTGRCNKTSAP